ncbi:MAG: CpaF/VirB11 family protein [Mollicutes bacterium]|nr:CpaF/VirB11 family protein [Mollicutes bacterium]MCI7058663.1 CpaF/VirB11 family protein [Mollicutes bacterium]MDD7715580.1 ATPase, T2SS/T4P/T4SS family [Mollicutes bacterium]MDY3904072.1 ATPase, T2SS/T4P/T4SS family [Candidatus Enteromonas sp.]MDY4935739.1 ATPase, T2SS/T4P/T4SS family [Candidatus Enteromonas sp.]
MDNDEKLKEFLETSFISPLLEKEGITDISYNGEYIFYQSNKFGRRKSEIDVTPSQVASFLRQIANYSEKQFSFLDPILDVSFSRYRINATFLSLTRVRNKKSYSFSIRIAYEGSVLENDDSFFGENSKRILLKAIKNKQSIVIGGETGAGKTELQKYLLMRLEPSSRVIVIDNVEELEMVRADDNLDLTSWVVDERNKKASYASLIKNALRNNPDYLVLAESRGEEMLDALNCVMSGHPIITTMHAKDIKAMPYRMARMAMMGEKKLEYDDLLGDIYHHFSLFVYVKRELIDGQVRRFIEAIARPNEKKKTVEIVYERNDENEA